MQAEFRRLSGLALGGDSDAAGQLAGVGNSLLDLAKQTAGTEEEYLDAFWAVNAQLKAAQEAAGAQVSEGQTVCLIEAMKMMNEVKAPCDCMVEELYGRDGELVEFGAPLLRYRPL